MLDLIFFYQSTSSIIIKYQLYLKSFYTSANAILDIYIIFISINDGKKGNNNYRYIFYTCLYHAPSLIVLAPNFVRIPSIFHVI